MAETAEALEWAEKAVAVAATETKTVVEGAVEKAMAAAMAVVAVMNKHAPDHFLGCTLHLRRR